MYRCDETRTCEQTVLDIYALLLCIISIGTTVTFYIIMKLFYMIIAFLVISIYKIV